MDKRTNRRAVIGRVRFEGRTLGSRWRPSGRRESRPSCDILEGRQLLSTTAATTTGAVDTGTQQPPAQVSPFDSQAAPDSGGRHGMGTHATSTATGTGSVETRAGRAGKFGSLPGDHGRGDHWRGRAPRDSTQAQNADGTTTPPAASSAALKADFDKLHTDMQAIRDKSHVTPALLAAVRDDVRSITKASTATPDAALVDAVAKDLAALKGATPDFTTGTLQADLEAVIKGSGVTDTALMTKFESDLNAVFQARGVTADDIATLQADVDRIQADGGPKAPDGRIVASLSEMPGMPRLSDLIGGGRDRSASAGAFHHGRGMGGGLGRHFGGPMGS